MAEYLKNRMKFSCRGVDLAHPVDLMPDGRYPRLTNVQVQTDGTIQPRPGFSLVADIDAGATSAVHSIIRLNDDVAARYARIVGAGVNLYSDNAAHNTYTQIDTGYSGKPLSICIHRPDQSPQPWAYIMDASRSRKVKSNGNDYPMGIAPPLSPPSAALAARNIVVIDDMESVGTWTNGGTAGAIALLVGKRVDTTITYILFDTGTTGWACVNPAALTSQLQAGMRLVVNTGGGTVETVLVEEVFQAITSTTIASIIYDSGNTGLCTIQLTAPTKNLTRDMMVRLAAAENVRVISVTEGLDGITSFRCSTTGTRVATNAVAGLASFRANFTNTHAAAETLKAEAFESTVTVGIGYITNGGLTLNISTINGRPLSDMDEMHVSIRVDNPANVKEIKILLDCDSATNDFTRNYFYHPVRPNDLTPAVKGTQTTLTTLQQINQRRQVEQQFRKPTITMIDENRQFSEFNVNDVRIDRETTIQTTTGDSQWSEVRFRIKDLIRVGSDTSVGLNNIKAIRIEVNALGTVVLDADSWWVGGTYGITGKCNYIYRYRSSETKARSNPSPPMRSPVEVIRGRVVLTPVVSTDTQVDKIDWYRFGDILNDWYYTGTQSNSGTFTDEYSDEVVVFNPLAEFDNYQPFPLNDIPRTGTCDVVGTEVTWKTGDTFNTSWARGSLMKVDGKPCTLFTSPTSSTRLSLNENMGTLSSVTFELLEATILGQPRAVMFGPYGGGQYGIFFFSVDNGDLIWTNPNNPDSASDRNRLEITSPSEPLINGCIYDGRPYVWSSERMFAVYPDFGGTNGFVAQEVANSQGLYARWGLCVLEGGLIYFIGRDGIYESEGGQARNITNNELYPLFPHDGINGIAVNGYSPPDFTQPDRLYLSEGDNEVFFDYIDAGGTDRTIRFDVRLRGWFPHTYNPTARCHYKEEGKGVNSILVGSSTGILYQVGGTSDAGTAISCQVRTQSVDVGDGRSRKTFADVWVDSDPNNETLTAQVGFDNHSTTIPVSTITEAAQKQSVIDIPLASQLARNISLDITWSSTTAKPILFEWSPSYLLEPEETNKRATDWTDGGYLGAKYFQGVRIEADTFNQTRTVEVHYIDDSGVDIIGATLEVKHNGQCVRDYSFTAPFYAYTVRLVPTDSNPWRYERSKFDFQPAPEQGFVWETPWMALSGSGYDHLRDGYISLISSDAVTMTVYIDDPSNNHNYTFDSTSNVQEKIYVTYIAAKGKLYKFRFASPAKHRIFRDECEVRFKSWGSDGAYQTKPLFGGMDNVSGAEI